ncbi:hypothetical protein AB0H49_14535 [Nocardia sp. NPDC050713]|uniref:hypothetical protein n=1 Tax=Nocardia sp. NPDC050713 TaxID=3154511 RepID=UPI0033CE305F
MSDLAAALVAAENEANFTDFVQGFTSGYGGGTRPACRGCGRLEIRYFDHGTGPPPGSRSNDEPDLCAGRNEEPTT